MQNVAASRNRLTFRDAHLGKEWRAATIVTIWREEDCLFSARPARSIRAAKVSYPSFATQNLPIDSRPNSRHRQVVNERRLPAIGITPANDRYRGGSRWRLNALSQEIPAIYSSAGELQVWPWAEDSDSVLAQ